LASPLPNYFRISCDSYHAPFRPVICLGQLIHMHWQSAKTPRKL